MEGNDRVDLRDIRVDTSYLNGDDGVPVGEVLKRLEFQRTEVLKLIPTDDLEIQRILKSAEAPSAIEGESLRERRERLVELVFQNPELKSHLTQEVFSGADSENGAESDDEEFYTPASDALIQARRFMVRDSLARARKRLQLEKSRASIQNVQAIIVGRRKLNAKLATYELQGSQVVSSRPISQVTLSPDHRHAACGSWKGDVQILNPETLEVIAALETAHDGKIGGLHWNSSSQLLVTGGADNMVKIWDPLSQDLKAEFRGHEARVARVKFHPSDKYIASASFDMTWRLWDVETQVELQLQEGHSKEVYSLDFQADGSLLCSAGLDSIARVWDLRSGQSLMVFKGHAKPIYGVSWSPNGHHIATGSGDGTVKVWDLRNIEKPFSILAHNNIVSDVNFGKNNGYCLVTSSYDKTIGVFAADSWIKLASLRGHTDKILSVDISSDGTQLLSCGWDRSVKKWSLN
ncbi:LANO_0H00540g1_1 [Lachancea nothofagi CBS 11611]|uniref:LANO_0H00540g1_1 n=1 Tax=Lachancea nothofagi CBS 11611 TaxID=1266666 RepID=A0A1G4KL41_9SACH|nr:LANO_0H00540g1_1 [Lachancea nothofagi CBS 11611]